MKPKRTVKQKEGKWCGLKVSVAWWWRQKSGLSRCGNGKLRHSERIRQMAQWIEPCCASSGTRVWTTGNHVEPDVVAHVWIPSAPIRWESRGPVSLAHSINNEDPVSIKILKKQGTIPEAILWPPHRHCGTRYTHKPDGGGGAFKYIFGDENRILERAKISCHNGEKWAGVPGVPSCSPIIHIHDWVSGLPVSNRLSFI